MELSPLVLNPYNRVTEICFNQYSRAVFVLNPVSPRDSRNLKLSRCMIRYFPWLATDLCFHPHTINSIELRTLNLKLWIKISICWTSSGKLLKTKLKELGILIPDKTMLYDLSLPHLKQDIAKVEKISNKGN